MACYDGQNKYERVNWGGGGGAGDKGFPPPTFPNFAFTKLVLNLSVLVRMICSLSRLSIQGTDHKHSW